MSEVTWKARAEAAEAELARVRQERDALQEKVLRCQVCNQGTLKKRELSDDYYCTYCSAHGGSQISNWWKPNV